MPNPTTAEWAFECHRQGHLLPYGADPLFEVGQVYVMCVGCADAYARQRVAAFRERAYKVLCQRCRNNEAVVFANPFPSVPETLGWHHVEKGGAMGGEDLWHDCAAAAIRALEP